MYFLSVGGLEDGIWWGGWAGKLILWGNLCGFEVIFQNLRNVYESPEISLHEYLC